MDEKDDEIDAAVHFLYKAMGMLPVAVSAVVKTWSGDAASTLVEMFNCIVDTVEDSSSVRSYRKWDTFTLKVPRWLYDYFSLGVLIYINLLRVISLSVIVLPELVKHFLVTGVVRRNVEINVEISNINTLQKRCRR